MSVPENVDPKTGEILEDDEGPISTVDFGNGPIDMDDKQAMEKGAEEFVTRIAPAGGEQLQLFEGCKVGLLKLKLMGGTIGETFMQKGTPVPRYRDVRYFVIKATVVNVGHRDKGKGEDKLVQRVSTFALDKIRFLDEITAKRLLKDKDGDQA